MDTSWGLTESECAILGQIVTDRQINTVLEFGPGISTQTFIQKNCNILSIETDNAYLQQQQELNASYANIEYYLYDQNNVAALKNRLSGLQFDLCFIDGPPAYADQYRPFNRIDAYALAFQHANYIIAHDSNRIKDRNSINLLFDGSYTIEELTSERGMSLIYKTPIV